VGADELVLDQALQVAEEPPVRQVEEAEEVVRGDSAAGKVS
jgi:hypothetical protein